jgi:hypothetical protein
MWTIASCCSTPFKRLNGHHDFYRVKIRKGVRTASFPTPRENVRSPENRSGFFAKEMFFDQTAQHCLQKGVWRMHDFLMERIGPLPEDSE